MRVVLDTNIWISGLLLPESICGQILNAWQNASFSVVTSSFILEEIRKVLTYSKIQKRLNFTQERIDEYFALIGLLTENVKIDSKNLVTDDLLKDINDVPVLTTLVISKAEYLVTGDDGLLVLHEKYPILSPQQFTKLLG